MVIRFRRSSGVERQQLKWFSFAASSSSTYFVFSAVLEASASRRDVGEVISGLAFLGSPWPSGSRSCSTACGTSTSS